MVLAALRRPTPMDAAIAIDDRLALKENSAPPSMPGAAATPSHAAVADAEKAAGSAVLTSQFPIHYPRRANAAIAVTLVAVMTAWLLPNFDMLGIQAHRQDNRPPKPPCNATPPSPMPSRR